MLSLNASAFNTVHPNCGAGNACAQQSAAKTAMRRKNISGSDRNQLHVQGLPRRNHRMVAFAISLLDAKQGNSHAKTGRAVLNRRANGKAPQHRLQVPTFAPVPRKSPAMSEKATEICECKRGGKCTAGHVCNGLLDAVPRELRILAPGLVEPRDPEKDDPGVSCLSFCQWITRPSSTK